MSPGLVSTIVPVHNRAGMLREAIASVIAQDWRPIEVIIVDDGSTDDTPDAIAALAADYPGLIRSLRQDNAGPGAARQTGLEAASGEFVQFLDSDDLLLPGKFRLQIGALRGDPEADICYGRTWASSDGVRAAKPAQRTGERHRSLFPAMLDEPLWPTLAPLYRRSLLDRVGPWPRAAQLEDWQYDAQAGALGVKLAYVDEFVAETRNHGGDRLCHRWIFDPAAMRDRLQAHVRVFELARQAGVDRDSPQMQRFARTLFWMARQAGARGFEAESRQLYGLARDASARPGWDLRLYGAGMSLLGPRRAARLAALVQGGAR